jgi:2',3'-cyclic-nucleotide 2'-phosphodiesterase (5'-nucleotidase family)
MKWLKPLNRIMEIRQTVQSHSQSFQRLHHSEHSNLFGCKMRLFLIWVILVLNANVAFGSDPDLAVITVVFSNDVHGGIDRTEARFMNDEFPPPLGGGASAATLITQLRQEAQKQGEGFLLLDAGDIFSGTLIGSQTGGKAVIEYMNAVGYNAMSVGNHEFDQGLDNLKALIATAQFPVLSANLLDSTGQPVDFVKPYIILEVNGLRVAIIGLTTHATRSMSSPSHLQGLQFGDEVQAATKAIAQARAEGAEFVIALSHLGLPYSWEEGFRRLQEREKSNFEGSGAVNDMELARRVPGLDVLFSGHIHVGYREPWVDPVTHVPCFQNYGRGSGLGLVKLKINRATGKLAGWESFADEGALATLFLEEFTPDTSVDRMIRQKADALAAVYQRPIAQATVTISRAGDGESPLGNLVTDAWREHLDADLAITNSGGLRDDLPPGNVTLQEIFNVLPFGNSLVVITLRGDEFRNLLKRKISADRIGFALSGCRLTIDLSLPEGQRIIEITIGGQPLQDDRTYKLATTEYLREGNSRFEALAAVPDDRVTYTGILEREAVGEYIAKLGVLEGKMDGRVRVVNQKP